MSAGLTGPAVASPASQPPDQAVTVPQGSTQTPQQAERHASDATIRQAAQSSVIGSNAYGAGSDGLSGGVEPDEAATREWFGTNRQWREWSRITGDWAGIRTRLEKAGIALSGTHASDWSAISVPGRRRAAVGRGLGDIGVTIDLSKVAGIPGGTAFVQWAGKSGGDGSVDSNNLQGFSSIDADDFGGIGEAWYEQSLAGDRLRVKIGRVDANSEFAQVEHASEFINPAMGYSPTILALPTYPLAVTSINLFAYPSEHFYLGAGIYDGRQPAAELSPFPRTDAFMVSEAGVKWAGGGSALDGRLAVGVWRHTARFYRLDDHGSVRGTGGLFVTIDQDIWLENGESEEGEEGIEAFAQFGTASPVVSEMDRHIGLGVTWTGMLRGRDRDTLGVGLTSVRLSDRLAVAPAGGTETSYDIFYKLQLSRSFSLKPDVQYIVHGAGAIPAHRVLAATCRVELTF